MKKKIYIISIVLVVVLVSFTLLVRVYTYNYSGYQKIVQNVIDKYGVFEQEGFTGEIYSGLIYGEFIDFDNNGVEELVLVYRNEDSSEGWGTVAVYSITNKKVQQIFLCPIDTSLTQTDASYKISYSIKEDGTYLIVDTVRKNPPENGWNEKRVIFTIKDKLRVCEVLYGEILDLMEYGEIIYTKCMINEEIVPIDKYKTINSSYDDSNSIHIYLHTLESGDKGNEQYISYSKLINFMNLLDQKADKKLFGET